MREPGDKVLRSFAQRYCFTHGKWKNPGNGKNPLNNSNSAVVTLTSRLDSEKNPVELEVRLNRNLLYQLPRIHLRLRLGTDKTTKRWVFDGFCLSLSQTSQICFALGFAGESRTCQDPEG